MELSFSFYKTKYLGVIIPDEEAFNREKIKATIFIDGLIEDGLISERIQDGFKLSACSLCEISYEEKNSPAKKSESIDGYSYTLMEETTANKKRLEVLKTFCFMELAK